MKNPTVLGDILKSLGLMEIWLSWPSLVVSSTASSKSLSLTKHNLPVESEGWGVTGLWTHSAAMANDMVVKDGERVSVYISQPVPCR